MRLGSSTLVLLVTLTTVTAALADATADTGDGSALEEIIVTAQRRSENLERTPVALSVISASDLANEAIVTESDLRTAVPGLTVRPTINSNDLTYSIRGQTVDAFSGSSPAVLPYINEVQIGGDGGASAFYDLQSVQVLKGPQGTLFGRNATGGAVLFTTVKPTNDLDGFITVRDGNYADHQVEGAVNVPIVNDIVLSRIAAYYEKRDGFQYDTISGRTLGNVDKYGARFSLTVNFAPSIKNELVVDGFHSGGSSVAPVLTTVAPQFANNAPIPGNLLYTPFLDTAVGFPGAFAAYSAGNPKIPAGGIYAFLAMQNARGPFVVSVDNELLHLANNFITTDIFSADITDQLQFKNVFGYSHVGVRDGDDADGSPYGIDGSPPGQPYGLNHTDKQYSEEPQLLGKAFNGALDYVTGLYFADKRLYEFEQSAFADLEPIAPPTIQNNYTLTKDTTYAGYAHGTYDLADVTGIHGLSANVGARYTSERVSEAQLPGSSFYFDPAVAPYHQELSDTFNKVSWQVGAQDQLSEDALVYIVSRRSFRSGGFNNLAPPVLGIGNAAGAEYEAETATDVELGAKFQGTVGSMPSRANVAIFDEVIDNTQRSVFALVAGSPGSLTVNVPKMRVEGLETDGEIKPARWLRMGGSLAYTDAKFTENEVTVPGNPPQTFGFGPTPDTPKWSGTIFSEVDIPVRDNEAFAIRGDVYEQGISYYSSANSTISPGTELPGYTIANFQLRFGDSKAGWSVAAVLKNAFNRVYYVGGLGAYNIFTVNAAIPGDPRTIVGEVSYKF